ncbi:MAG: hybrid sensor histidine kinase/response regulator, partial [Bacteroidia bacterium]|nr:hybrid sensor histidine kinase/response regulator [Bacteroidia bacterium]
MDISEKRQTENALLRANRELEEALLAKNSFISVISHEIRTPLNAIIGLSYALTEDSLIGRQREIVDTIYFSARNLLTLINDILDYSKIQAGQLSIERLRFDLHEQIHQTHKLYQAQAQEKNLDFQ